ncbi:rhomboid family intramembrane serine protease [bacterium]|nr:rhomboid family intramembrane serine protease [bacterium]
MILIPIRDENPSRRRSVVTGTILAANVAVFAGQLAGVSSLGVERLGFVPGMASVAEAPRLFSSMFLHGSILHIAGNLIYLWVFGNNVEDVLGPARFAFFYLAAGLGGHAAQWLSDPGSVVPVIGASGAISGILAAYWIRFPHARVHTILFLFVLVRWVRVPAGFVIGYWLVLQLVNGLAQFGGGAGGGVAWFEHLGGFAVGALLFLLMAGTGRRRRRA